MIKQEIQDSDINAWCDQNMPADSGMVKCPGHENVFHQTIRKTDIPG